MPYTVFSHRHNFAVWAAARASQRGFTGSDNLREALEQCGVVDFAKKPGNLRKFDHQHRLWCESICKHLDEKRVKNTSYGRAAKLVNIYLKTMVVLADPFGRAALIIHPPIDRILLRNLAEKSDADKETKRILRKTNWTQLDQTKYFELVDILRILNVDRPFWMIEEYWFPTS